MLANESMNVSDASKSSISGKNAPLLPWFRARLLLQFMEMLDKLMHTAIDGTAMALASPPKLVKTFFRTNRQTCREWTNRIRLQLMVVALNNEQCPMVIRLAWQAFHDLQHESIRPQYNVDLLTLLTVQALEKMGCAFMIEGLKAWLKETLGQRVHWLKFMAEKSVGSYEAAAAGLSSVIYAWLAREDPLGASEDFFYETEKRCSGITPQATNVIVNEVLDCYLKVNDFESAMKWTDTVTDLQPMQLLEYEKAFVINNNDSNYIKALSSFQQGLAHREAAENYFELTPKQFGPRLAWSQRAFHAYFDYRLLDAALQLTDGHKATSEETPKTSSNVSLAAAATATFSELSQLANASEFMQICAQFPPRFSVQTEAKLKCLHIVEASLVAPAKGIKSVRSNAAPVFSPGIEHSGNLERVDVVNNVLYWVETASKYRKTATTDNGVLSAGKILSLKHSLFVGAKAARKFGNYKHSESLLRQLLSHDESAKSSLTENDVIVHSELSQIAMNPTVRLQLSPREHLHVCLQASKLLYASQRSMPAFELLYDAVTSLLDDGRLKIQSRLVGSEGLSSRLISSVASVLRDTTQFPGGVSMTTGTGSWCLGGAGGKGATGMIAPGAVQEERELPAMLARSFNRLAMWMQAETESKQFGGVLLKSEDSLFVKLLEEQLDHVEAPDSNSVVGALLNMSVNICPTLAKSQAALASWAYKSGRKAIDASSLERLSLRPDEIATLQSLVPEYSDILIALVTSKSAAAVAESEELEAAFLAEMVAVIPQLSAGALDAVAQIWRAARLRLFKQYETAASAYFYYLQLTEKKTTKDATIVTAALRLLRLLVKYSKELMPTLEKGFAETSVNSWKSIIPQLFARLNHPLTDVRSIITQLICRIASGSPELIVFPAVVGFVGGISRLNNAEELFIDTVTPGDLDTTDSGIESAPVPQDNNALEDSVMQTAYGQIVDALGQVNADLVAQVKAFVAEMQRITLLREEMWLTVLTHLQHEVNRRLEQLRVEVEKTQRNSALDAETKRWIISEKNHFYMHVIYRILEDLHVITSATAETPNERTFLESYSPMIGQALAAAKSAANQNEAWVPFRQLLAGLLQRSAKRTSLALEMADISPALLGLKNTLIPIPGLEPLDGQPITLAAVLPAATILPTKTKPKKLAFLGSDGKKYTYLFKGLEDLHLDERIMQFLEVCNAMFKKIRLNTRELFPYYARHYSVTPLGPRSGLIQWVEGAMPVFSVYKRWQMREAALLPPERGGGPSRPSELYYLKLEPALKKRGVNEVDEKKRRDWPLAALREVLQELISTTPRDLLQKEFWCLSTDPSEWWTSTRRFAQSCAVMSMIGYIIGLGDRHLDNLLVDLRAGEVVHIDYNVCFDKGRHLRVPERVPFRMSPNIQAALGPFGVEGIFRLTSEEVLRTLRANRETLLTLLEAFVYDPLVDWTATHDGGVTGLVGSNVLFAVYGTNRAASADFKQQIQDAALRMFRARIREVESVWCDNKKSLLEALANLSQSLTSGIAAQDSYQTALDNLDLLERQTGLIGDALLDPNHKLHSLAERHLKRALVAGEQDEIILTLKQKAEVAEQWCQAYRKAFSTLYELPTLQEAILSVSLNLETSRVAAEFLHQAGQSDKLNQCKDAENEVHQCLTDLKRFLSGTLVLLSQYAALQTVAPQKRFFDHRIFHWHQLLTEALSNYAATAMGATIETAAAAPLLSGQEVTTLANLDAKLEAFLADRLSPSLAKSSGYTNGMDGANVFGQQWSADSPLNALFPLLGSGSSGRPVEQSALNPVLSDIKTATALIVTARNALLASQEKLTAIEVAIQQRLKWAAGANPGVAETLSLVEKAVMTHRSNIESFGSVCTDLCFVCESLVHFENFSAENSEMREHDKAVYAILKRYVLFMAKSSEPSVALEPLEQLLLIANPINAADATDAHWLKSTQAILDQSIANAKCVLESTGLLLDRLTAELHDSALVVRSVLAGHRELMLEIRTVLKSLGKCEEANARLGTRFTRYTVIYRLFCEQVTICLKTVAAASLSIDDVRPLLAKFATLTDIVESLYSELLELRAADFEPGATAGGDFNERYETLTTKLLSVGRGLNASISSASSTDEEKRQTFRAILPEGRKGTPDLNKKLAGADGQERNAHALNIWRHVKLKLEGRDPDPSKKSTVIEQVGHVIREATSIDNLAVMYEGWTAWV